ncbi:MAG TPA: hypothetical protein VIL55_01265 [Naasia sp.]
MADQGEAAESCAAQERRLIDEAALDLPLEADPMKSVGCLLGKQFGVVVRESDELAPEVVGNVKVRADEAGADCVPGLEPLMRLDGIFRRAQGESRKGAEQSKQLLA